ncbi:MAG: hypothetical protein AAFX79_12285 [Planctomycetota bacterium]
MRPHRSMSHFAKSHECGESGIVARLAHGADVAGMLRRGELAGQALALAQRLAAEHGSEKSLGPAAGAGSLRAGAN